MELDRYKKSKSTLKRALKTVPLGSQTFSKSYQQLPRDDAPFFLERGLRGRVWDIDGNEYVDLVCGLLSVVLGYKHEAVDKAITSQLEKGISFSLATRLEHVLAEKLCALIPCAERVRFGKNGTDATSTAIPFGSCIYKKESCSCAWVSRLAGLVYRCDDAYLGVPDAVGALTKKSTFQRYGCSPRSVWRFRS